MFVKYASGCELASRIVKMNSDGVALNDRFTAVPGLVINNPNNEW
jgi:hypothetical protein